MASYAPVKAVSKTLTGTTVDTITFAATWPIIEIINRAASNTIWVTYSTNGTAPAAPTAAGDECEPILPGERIAIINSHNAAGGAIIKILGSGDAYTVVGAQRA